MQSPISEAINEFLNTAEHDKDEINSIECPTKTTSSNSIDVLQIYSDDDQFRRELNKLRLQSVYTDVKLICQGIEIDAHKFILASGSDYFYGVFAQTASPDFLVLNDVEPMILEELITFLYTGKLNIAAFPHQKLGTLIKYGTRLKIYYIEHSILHYLVDHLNENNFSQALKLSTSLQDSPTEDQIVKYLGDHIDIIWTSPGFTHISQKHVIAIFQNIHQELTSHDVLLRGMLMWIAYKSDERRGCLSKLLQFINFEKVSVSLACFLLHDDFVRFRDETKILRTELISKIGLKTEDVVNQAKLAAMSNAVIKAISTNETSEELHENTPTDIGEKVEDVLAVIGRDHANRAVVVKYNFVRNVWSDIQDTGASLDINPGIGYSQNRVYFIGGQDYRGNKLSNVRYFDMTSASSTELNDLCVPRAGPGILCYDNSLLVVGGLGRFSRQGLSLTEHLDLKDTSSKWIPARQLRLKRGDGTRLMLVDGSVVITGGESTKCEYYDDRRQSWVLSQPVPDALFETALFAVADGKLCAFKYFKPNSMYKLDMTTGEWGGNLLKGKPPEWAVSAVGWKSIIFVIDKARSLFILDTVDRCWTLTSKIPKKIVYPVFVGI